jgi:hypothetical protein
MRNRDAHDPRCKITFSARDLSEVDSRHFCGEIVQAIQALGKPYDVDHPEFSFEIPEDIRSVLRLFEGAGDVYSVTPAFAHEYGVDMWTVLPNEKTKAAFLSVWSGRPFDWSILKWRVFYKRDKGTVLVSPMLVSNCTTEELATSWKFEGCVSPFQDLLLEIRNLNSCDRELAEFRAGVFFVEILWGLQLLRYVSPYLPGPPDLDESNVRVVFGKRFGEKVAATARQVIHDLWVVPELVSANKKQILGPPRTRWALPQLAELRREIVSKGAAQFHARPTFTGKLAVIFEALQNTMETKASRQLTTVARPAIVAQRLLIGFSPEELSDLVEELSGEKCNADLLSLAIDVADTNGVLVPKTSRLDDQLGRYLAYGEDTHHTCIPLLKSNLEVALGWALPKLAKIGDQEELEFDRIEWEKSLVFALTEFNTAASVRSGFPLSRALYCVGACNHPPGDINLEATIHGHYLAVDVAENDGASPLWMTDWLIKEELLEKGSSNNKKLLPHARLSSVAAAGVDVNQTGALGIAERLYLMRFLQRNVTPHIQSARGSHALLVAITSCASERRFAYALRADLKEFFASPRSAYSPGYGGRDNIWDSVDYRLGELCPRNGLGPLTGSGKAIPAISNSANELLYKITLFRNRRGIAGDIARFFEPGTAETWPLYIRHLQPIIQEMQVDRKLDFEAQAFLTRLVWLSEAVGQLWTAFRAFLDVFNIAWLFPKTTNPLHIKGFEEGIATLDAAIDSLKALSEMHAVNFGSSKASELLKDLQEITTDIRLGKRPMIPQARVAVQIFKCKMDSLRMIFRTLYLDRHAFLASLGSHFPAQVRLNHCFRIQIDLRDSSPEASLDLDGLRQKMTEIHREIGGAVANYDGFECRQEGGDSILVRGEHRDGALSCIRACRNQVSMGRYLRVTIVHDRDAIGFAPPADDSIYDLARRLSSAIDSDGKKKYPHSVVGCVMLVSGVALRLLGGKSVFERDFGVKLIQDRIIPKGEEESRTYWHAAFPSIARS